MIQKNVFKSKVIDFMCFINFIDYYIPQSRITIDSFLDSINKERVPKIFGNFDEYSFFVKNILKLDSLSIEQKLTSCEMIEEPLRKMFDNGVIKPEMIDLIVFVPEAVNNDRKNLPQYIQQKYKMTNAAIIYISGNHCVNIEVALSVCKSMLIAEKKLNNILIISSSKTSTLEERIVGSYGVYGDAAAVLIINKQNGIGIKDIVNVSCGDLFQEDLNTDNSILHCRNTIKTLNRIIADNKISNSNINRILVHNANTILIRQCLRSKGLDENKIFTDNLGRYGHLNHLDFVVNLKDLKDQTAEGSATQNILTFGSGWSGSYVSSYMSV